MKMMMKNFKVSVAAVCIIVGAGLLTASVAYSDGVSEIESAASIDGDGATLYKYEPNDHLRLSQFVKFIVYLDSNQNPSRIEFQNTQKYPFHSDFLLTTDVFKGLTRAEIDQRTFKNSPKRTALLGTLFMHTVPIDAVTPLEVRDSFELVTEEFVIPELVAKVQNLLLESSPQSLDATVMAYMASGVHRQQILSASDQFQKVGIKVHNAFQSNRFQAYVEGWTIGKIVVVKGTEYEAALKAGQIKADSILVTDTAPREIPPVAGIILSEPTADSSHVVLLAEMYQIPMATDPNIFKTVQDLSGRTVYLNMTSYGIKKLVEVDQQTQDLLLQLRKKKSILVKADFTENRIQKTSNLTDQKIPAYGGKSVRLGHLKRTLPSTTPQVSVAIPIHFFKRFLNEAITPNGQNLNDEVEKILSELSSENLSYSQIVDRLAQIRNLMKATPIPSDIVLQIKDELAKLIPVDVKRLKLRSSSNVEDGAEFNGAGLYDSEGVWFRDPPAGKENDFEKGLNKIWRSIYTDRGFLARQNFGVDESLVGMGILVQETFKGELANGVAIWTPATNEWSGPSARFVGFPGEEQSVANPDGSVHRPEIVKLTEQPSEFEDESTWMWIHEVQQKTDLLPIGQSLLTPSEYQELALSIKKIAKAWAGTLPKAGLDLEWKLLQSENGKRSLLIKQVRPLVDVDQNQKLSDGSEFVFLGGFPEHLKTDYPEMKDAFAQHFCPVETLVTLPTVTEKQLLARTLLIPKIQFKHYGKIHSLQNVLARVESILDVNGKRDFQILFDIIPEGASTSDRPRLQFVLMKGYETESQNVIDSLAGQVYGDPAASQLAKKFFPQVTDYKCSLSSRSVLDEMYLDSGKREFKNLKAEIKTAEGSIQLSGRYQILTGYDKTYFYLMDETIVTGFGLKAPVTISTPQASVYAPEHHNFSWGVSVDFLSASGLTDSEKAAFVKRNGRYFLFDFGDTGGSKAAWLKPNGQMKVLKKPVWKSLEK